MKLTDILGDLANPSATRQIEYKEVQKCMRTLEDEGDVEAMQQA